VFIENARSRAAPTELAHELSAIGDELERGLEESRKKPPNPADMAQFHLFDLRKLVLQCLCLLPEDARISGFLLSTPTRHLLQYFCESLKHRAVQQAYWKGEQVHVASVPLSVELPHTPLDVAYAKACKHRARLQTKIVVCSVFVQDAADAEALWARLRAEFPRELANPFVVVFGMPNPVRPPAGLALLPCPTFTQKDVRDWVAPIVESLKWQKELTERWTRAIVAEYVARETDLPIEWTYEQLAFHREMLTCNRTESAFNERLVELIGDWSCARSTLRSATPRP